MSDLISRQSALAEFKDGRDVYDIMESIEELPSAEPPYQYSKAYVEQIRGERDILQDMVDNMAEPKTGEWVNRERCQVDEDAYEVATCSECGAEITIEYPHDNYCPNCGADMRGENHE